jgi:hypothetical protein
MWRAITAALLAGGAMVPVSAAAADNGRVVSFQDPRISESSGLVDLGGFVVTTNDSGSTSKLFTVDLSTGRTVGITDYHADAVDVEALAPGGGSTVWVGDIGDNNASRKSVSVYRVKVGTGMFDVHPARYRLVYPGGPRNAESLFVDRQGRLFVVTKSLFGGMIYRAPFPLSPTGLNRLQPVARVIEFATDAAMLSDGRHVVVRGPGNASIYSYPGFRRVGGFALPPQRQGEGISAGTGARLLVSSEGEHSAIRRAVIPTALLQRLAAPAPTATPTPTATPSPSGSASPSASASPSGAASPSASPAPGPDSAKKPPQKKDPWLMWSIPAVIVVGAVGIGFGLRRR